MKEEVRQQVFERANSRCEYCRMPADYDPLPFGIDHIRARYHHGPTVLTNLAAACFHCNTYKSNHAGGYDPVTQKLTRLFNPRTDTWSQHFAWNGPEIEGATPIGRTTVDVLRMNRPDRVEHRRCLSEEGIHFQAE